MCVCVCKGAEGAAAAVCCKSVADKLLLSDLLQGGEKEPVTYGWRDRRNVRKNDPWLFSDHVLTSAFPASV